MIAYLTLEIRIEGAHSLKDKRQVVRSVKDGLRAHFNVAVAELDASEAWQRATLGVVSISGSRDYLEGLMRNVERHAMRIANNAAVKLPIPLSISLVRRNSAVVRPGNRDRYHPALDRLAYPLTFSHFAGVEGKVWRTGDRSTIVAAWRKPCGKKSSLWWKESWATLALAWSASAKYT